MMRQFAKRPWWLLGLGTVLASCMVLQQVGCGVAEDSRASTHKASAEPAAQSDKSTTRVVVVKPSNGGIPRTTVQPATMESFDFADLFAKVSGYVKEQSVDIGDKVEEGQVLAIIDMPELYSELDRAKAAKVQAEAHVALMRAHVTTARANLDAAKAAIDQADAELVKATSFLKFREIQYERVKKLFEKDAIDERLVDEKDEQREAAHSAQLTAKAAILTAKAEAAAAAARVTQAEADVADAQAKVQVDQALVGKAEVFVAYTKIRSPYTGVITKRNFHPGDFIRAADQGGTTPLLTVARTDIMRVIVQVPERDVPYTEVGDAADVEMDALKGEIMHATVSRFANSEDRLTRTMHTEIDLKNPGNRLRDGMFGRATIFVDNGTKGMTLPKEALVSQGKKKFAVFVVKDGTARRTPVEVGQDDGIRVEIHSGVSLADDIVVRPPGDLADGAAVDAKMATEDKFGKTAEAIPDTKAKKATKSLAGKSTHK